MPISLRMPIEKENKLKRLALKQGKSKTAIILEAMDEKLGLTKDRAALIRSLAGWMSDQEARALRNDLSCFGKIHDGDWP